MCQTGTLALYYSNGTRTDFHTFLTNGGWWGGGGYFHTLVVCLSDHRNYDAGVGWVLQPTLCITGDLV